MAHIKHENVSLYTGTGKVSQDTHQITHGSSSGQAKGRGGRGGWGTCAVRQRHHVTAIIYAGGRGIHWDIDARLAAWACCVGSTCGSGSKLRIGTAFGMLPPLPDSTDRHRPVAVTPERVLPPAQGSCRPDAIGLAAQTSPFFVCLFNYFFFY